MPIKFTCPYCGILTNVADKYAGQSGQCAECSETITIPLADEEGTPVARSKKSCGPIVIIIPVLLIALGCFGMLLSRISFAPEAARRAHCASNLKQIGRALHGYHDQHGSFPPAYIAGENGKPIHSWRVLLLPFLDEQHLHDQYNFDEPWDSPHNLALADLMPAVYHCSSDTSDPQSETSYFMITGPGTVGDGTKAAKIKNFKDGTSKTIIVIEAAAAGVNWMDPRDIKASGIDINASNHPSTTTALFANGCVKSISNRIDPKLLKAACSIGGGEKTGAAELTH